jgi:hypothetical protein
MFYHVRNSPSPILPAFGYSTIMPEKLGNGMSRVRVQSALAEAA